MVRVIEAFSGYSRDLADASAAREFFVTNISTFPHALNALRASKSQPAPLFDTGQWYRLPFESFPSRFESNL
jgi:hypothetical protein